jgi:mannose-1-phosphate guanylyltransferase/mannose-6-phosphate isomerase
MNIQPVILSGGSGTRLWPLSREQYPKQLLPLTGEQSLLQETVLRLEGLAGEAITVRSPLVVCNEQHRFLVAEQLRQVDEPAAQIVLEPAGRNTAPALAVAALASRRDDTEDPILLVMPADHLIADTAAFHEAVRLGATLAEAGSLVTFGIVPTAPETGYGYLRKGEAVTQSSVLSPQSFSLDRFVEKPDTETAQRYLASGEYLWNSGMFMMRASVWLQALERLQPAMAKACHAAFEQGTRDLDFYRLDKTAFEACPSDSIDYAVMEKVCGGASGENRVAVIPLDAGWSDVGAWSALWEVGQRDADGNLLRGDVATHNTQNTLVHAEHRFVASVGVENLLVVETADAVLVAHRDHAQDVKRIVEWLKTQDRDESLVHRKVYRPWGAYEGIDVGERFQVKRITVNPGASLSLQMHHHRAEHWIVVKGTAKVTCGDEVFLLTENQSTYIPIGDKHRLENPGTLPLELIEVQSGGYLGEDDIVRFDDIYGR